MGALISVIVPVYKVEEYLDKCVQSIVDQTYQNLEIILVDDKSPDMCPEKCDEWAKKDNRIVVIHKENQGVGEARNSGLDLAHGEYISFVDSDDYLPKDAIAALYNRIQADGSELAVGKYERVFPDGSVKESSSCDWFFDTVFDKRQTLERLNADEQPIYCVPWAKLYKKEILCGLRYMTLKVGEDLQLWPHILNRCNKISLVSQNVYYYFQRETSVMHIMNEQMQKDQIRSTALVAKYMLELGVTSAAQRHYVRTICYICSAEIPRCEARAIFYQIFSKADRKQMMKASAKIRIWYIGMHIPGFWKFVSVGKRLVAKIHS